MIVLIFGKHTVFRHEGFPDDRNSEGSIESLENEQVEDEESDPCLVPLQSVSCPALCVGARILTFGTYPSSEQTVKSRSHIGKAGILRGARLQNKGLGKSDSSEYRKTVRSHRRTPSRPMLNITPSKNGPRLQQVVSKTSRQCV